ncbi:translation initiation factor IF-2-like [Panicum miliaceum]|uniref:Translation initiation factor IF-2-like n=1 Tax=Panicum miliaceum TaxID=4540 RepID=A0A3L6SR42_PANMI|nr:translation initiation factor IF-2-like [Panicum miliaceum]
MGTTAKKPLPPPPSLPLPPALFLVRARSRASRVADLGDTGAAAWPSGPPDTPPRRSPVTVPFLWEEAPGKPKAPPQQPSDGGTGAPAAPAGPVVPSDVGAATSTTTTTTTTAATGAGDNDNGGGDAKEARPAPLKLPPRLQRVASAKQRDGSLSPRTVLHGPHYYGCAGGGRRPPRRTASGFAAFRRMPSAGVGLFSRSKTTAPAAGTKRNKGGGGGHDHLSAAAPDAPWCSPAASSASTSSSSSLSASCFGDDPGHRRPADGHEDGSSEEDECAGGSVRITRFTRNRSLPTMTTSSHLWCQEARANANRTSLAGA